jgi:hypothetical protein
MVVINSTTAGTSSKAEATKVEQSGKTMVVVVSVAVDVAVDTAMVKAMTPAAMGNNARWAIFPHEVHLSCGNCSGATENMFR